MEAILLDAAGTLFDLQEPVGETYARIGRDFGFQLPAESVESEFRKAFPAASAPDYSSPLPGDQVEKECWKSLVQQATHLSPGSPFDAYFEKLFAHYAQASAWKLYPDTLPFLAANQSHYRLAVVSNFDQRLLSILDGLQLTPYFEFILTSSEARAQKPDPQIFQLALQKLNLPAEKVLHIGDSRKADYEGALASSLQAIHLQRKNGDQLSLKKR